MSKRRVSIRLADGLVAFADNEVAAGRAQSRSEVVRRALQVYRRELSAAAYREAAIDPTYRTESRALDRALVGDDLPEEDFADWIEDAD